MAVVTFSNSEWVRVEEILVELNPTIDELTERYFGKFDKRDWLFIRSYIRMELRSAMQLGAMLRAVGKVALEQGLANEEAIKCFVQVNSRRNFGLLDPAQVGFEVVSEVNDCKEELRRAIQALSDLANDRMFGTIDEEYAELVARVND
jgi:hypothetical protein